MPGAGIVREFGKVMYTLLHLKWITNKNLLYSTLNSAVLHASVDVCVWGGVVVVGVEWIHVHV